jgi:hypothetical protein
MMTDIITDIRTREDTRRHRHANLPNIADSDFVCVIGSLEPRFFNVLARTLGGTEYPDGRTASTRRVHGEYTASTRRVHGEYTARAPRGHHGYR